MSKKRGGLPGRPCRADKPCVKVMAVRLSDAEIQAIKSLQINFSQIAREAIAKAIAERRPPEMERAS